MLASTLLAQRSLDAHVLAVAKGLETEGLSGGRMAVAHIVGRETQGLDEAAICRAAIESLAENFSDGVVAPLFWMVVAGLPGALAYKAVNTADSMIGHRTERYEDFGWASARFDDLVNLPASRLSALWLVLAAIPLGLSPGAALRTIRRDASHHRSPNAGWPEAAMAGALGIRLSGPRVYDGVPVRRALGGRRSQPADGEGHPHGAETLSHGLRLADRGAGPDRVRLAGLVQQLVIGDSTASSRLGPHKPWYGDDGHPR